MTWRRRPGFAVALGLTALPCLAPPQNAQEPPCEVGAPLPAYAHNDYENARPLFDALALGYQGVEADFHLVDGALLVAHDRHEVRPERTLESLYLAPLRGWIQRCGTILADGRPFQLNIEAKTEGYGAYHAMTAALARYRDMLTVVRDGREIPGPVQVVLVGWSPPLDELAAEPERLAAVQWYADHPEGVPDAPAHLIRLISLDYGRITKWDGRGNPPADVQGMLARLVAARDAVPGRRARVHAVPVNGRVYQFLLAAGVDLIGSKDLSGTGQLLTAPWDR